MCAMEFAPYHSATAQHDTHAAHPLLTRHASTARLATRLANRPPATGPAKTPSPATTAPQ